MLIGIVALSPKKSRTMKTVFITFLQIFLVNHISAQLSGKQLYNGQEFPGRTPAIFAQGIISVENVNTHALVYSPDYKMILFSRYPDRTSYLINIENGKWSKPAGAPFFGKEVSFSPDGNRIYFYHEAFIFYIEKTETGWSETRKLPSTVNDENNGQYYPCMVNSGSLYFSRNPKWNEGRIMYSEFRDGNFLKAVDLGAPVNEGGASHAWIAPDESYMLFNSPREGSYTQNDIWVSFRNFDKTWGNPINAGEVINSGADAILCPTVSPDGKYLFFTRLKFGEKANTGYVYWVSFEVIKELRPTN